MNGEKLNLTKENPEECGVCVIRYEFDESEADDIQLVMTDGVSGGTTGHFHQAID
jgi:U32 family peptidase